MYDNDINKANSYMYDDDISVNWLYYIGLQFTCICFSCMNNSVISFMFMCGQPCQNVAVNKNSFTNNGSLLQCVHFILIFIFENYMCKSYLTCKQI